MKLCSDFLYNVSLKHSMTKWARCDKNLYLSTCKVADILVMF